MTKSDIESSDCSTTMIMIDLLWEGSKADHIPVKEQ